MRSGDVERDIIAALGWPAQDGRNRLKQVGEEARPVFGPYLRPEMPIRRLAQIDQRRLPLRPDRR